MEVVPRRNRNFRVKRPGNRGLFIKQPMNGDASYHRTLRSEAEFYERYVGECSRMVDLAVRLIHYEPVTPLLVLEFLPTHRTLREYYGSFTPPQFPIRAAHEVGRRLGALHRTLERHDSRGPGDSAGGPALPWISRAHQPDPECLRYISQAGLRVLSILQASQAIVSGLDRFGTFWEPGAFIHGDVRGENILLRVDVEPTYDIRFVDWEMSQVGDPAWDVAGLLQDVVLYWLGKLPLTDVDRMAGTSVPMPWPVLQAASRALWQGYRATASGAPAEDRSAAVKVAYLAAARMVQSVVEMTADRAEIPPAGVLVLQVCEHIMADPQRGASDFFAIL